MKSSFLIAAAFSLILVASSAFAYQLKKSDNTDCTSDGSTCNVYCDNGHLAGSMNWNKSVWTDGVKSDADKDAMAKKIVAADGTACH
jgi:hypothetical protein